MTVTLLRSRSVRIVRVAGACKYLPENNYQRSMDEVKVTFITDESLGEFTVVLPKHGRLQRRVIRRAGISS